VVRLLRGPPVVGWSACCGVVRLLRGGPPVAGWSACCGVVSRPPHLSDKEVCDVQIGVIVGRVGRSGDRPQLGRTRGQVGRPPTTVGRETARNWRVLAKRQEAENVLDGSSSSGLGGWLAPCEFVNRAERSWRKLLT
jgi:hypothetical protein